MATKQTPNKKAIPKKKQTKKVASTTAANVESEGLVIDKLNAVLAWIKRNPAPFLLIVTLLVGLLWFGYVSYVKWQFSQAEKEVGRLSTAIIDELGTPQSTDTLKSCSYKSEKYAYGQTDAMCSVRTLLTYDVDNANEASETSQSINDVVSRLYKEPTQQGATYEEGRLNTSVLNGSREFIVQGFRCWSYVDYNGYRDSLKDSPYVNISIGCGKKVNFYRIYPEL
jgi:hypothetical protein